MQPKIDHIQITVKDLAQAESFYDTFLSILGFDLSLKTKGRVAAHEFDVIEYPHDQITIGINSPRAQFAAETVHRRKPGALHHLAFSANSEAEVDGVYAQLKDRNIRIVAPPQLYPQHGSHYYALFIKDPGGIKFEVAFEK